MGRAHLEATLAYMSESARLALAPQLHKHRGMQTEIVDSQYLTRHAQRWTDARWWPANTVQNRPDSLAGSTVRRALGITPRDIEVWALDFGSHIVDDVDTLARVEACDGIREVFS